MVCSVIRGAAVTLFVAASAHAVTPPRDGGPLPEGFFQTVKKDATAFVPRRAWAQKAEHVRAERRAFVARYGSEALSSTAPGHLAVTGTMRVPVLPGNFKTSASIPTHLPVPVTAANLQNQLFDSNPTGTITQYYSEVSYGLFTISGDVKSWTNVANFNAYYAGSSNGLVPGNARTGEFIAELLAANDAATNFGLYDNDGPDGVPNSGDDDGFVDLLCVLHSTPGYECGTYPGNINSHQWTYSAWPNSSGLPYTTNDPAAGGGFIKIDDYVIGPALNCNPGTPDGQGKYPQSGWIDIGVFCHEFGHGLGLPDLYDRNGGSVGIGHWGIMGSGSWNTPEKPAHPEAWTRATLGWTVPTDIGWQPVPVLVPDAERNAVSFRLPFTDERFRRSGACVIAGSYSLYCGLTEAEATVRKYLSPGPGGGYGPNWYETIERPFAYSGAGPVSFQYKFKYDLEATYDFGYALIEVNGVETQLAVYTGVGNGTATIDLTPHLAPLAGAGGSYTLKFRVISDVSFDDADGNDPSACGALAIDDVSVTGGGQAYTTGFEVYVDGWYQDPAENPDTEYWLVENRQRIGSDVNLHGTGLLVWHVDEEILRSPWMQNDGTGGGVRGLVLEEADGLFNLLNPPTPNFGGDAGDPYPGTTGNTSFTSLTSPASTDNTARSTQAAVTGIGPSAATMTATLRAGNRGPLPTAVAPTAIDNDQVAVQVEIAGSRIQAGATFVFVLPGGASSPSGVRDGGDIVPVSLQWVDGTLLRGTVNVYSKTAGAWNLVVTNPDGQSYTLPGAITINHIVATRLRSASIVVIRDGVRLQYVLADRDPGEVVRLYRSNQPDGAWRVIAGDLQPVRYDDYEFVDGEVESGKTYYYLLESVLASGEARELHRGSATVPARELVLDQNHPNPFNPRTSIRFYLPARVAVELDVYDVHGALVRGLARGTFDAGPHAVAWDGTDDAGRPVASGVYVYRLTADRRWLSRKMMLLK